MSKKVFEDIKNRSLESFRGFKLNHNKIKKLKRGQSVNIQSYANRRIIKPKLKNLKTNNFFIIHNLFYNFLYKNLNFELYEIIDEDNEYIQLVLLDTNNVKEMIFVSGYANPKDLISFKKF